MDAKTDENHGAVAGQVERSVRPLVERLRAGENFYAESSLWFDSKLAQAVDEAADEIERLRAALAEIADGVDTWTAEGMAHLAREALGPNAK